MSCDTAEKSWDFRCHGSGFSTHEKMLTTSAKRDLEKIDLTGPDERRGSD
ncbi:MAG: hypothetical protein ABIO55_04255 [Ginsengibacter sp.]